MPNWCFNNVEVYDTHEDGANLDLFATEEDFSKIDNTPLLRYVPMSEYHNTQEGFNDGGYDWCVANWGAKWPEKRIDFIGNTSSSLTYSFDSAWAPPIVGYQTISDMFPELYFLHVWREDGMMFAGAAIYCDGSIVFMREINDDGFPEWTDEDEANPDAYDEKLQSMMDSLTDEANSALASLMRIE